MRQEVLITGMSKLLKEGKEGAATAMSWGKSIPGRDSSQCKGPEAEDEEVEGYFRRQKTEIVQGLVDLTVVKTLL